MKRTLLAAAVAVLSCTAAQAAVEIDAIQSGGNVVFSASGSIDLAGATEVANAYTSYNVGVIPGGNNWYFAEGDGGAVNAWALTSAAGAFGTSTTFFDAPSVSTGEDFGIWGYGGGGPRILLGRDYVSGTAFTGGLEYDGTTLSAMGLTAGTYVYVLPHDTITLKVASSVPEPASGALMAMGLLAFALARRGRASSGGGSSCRVR